MTKAPLPSPTSKRDDSAPPPTARPPLQRLAASDAKTYQSHTQHPSPHAPHAAHTTDDEATDTEMSEEGSQPGDGHGAGGAPKESRDDAPLGKASPDEMEVERLRGLQLKMLQQQQRARMRSSSNSPTVAVLGSRRISPIKEEPLPGISPTLEGAFSSPSPSPHPLPTNFTASTESTESARTIRGSMPPTPAAHAVRTPSYPFPTVPNTPRWASAFHMPFTSLSPTVLGAHPREYAMPKERIVSESSTPAASSTPFAPAGRNYQSPDAEDPRFPSPNLYDIVLHLGAEPGLAAWWTAVTSIMRDHYGAERATLAVPADASDIENVPWGQKTTFTATANNGSPHAATYQEAMGQSRNPQSETPGFGKTCLLIHHRRP
ncbi:hypothetical protein P3342_000574 [Pyrenophora teres f. teres]|nr:hypothetical protein P3342_000574 [Pyrenophora teres f. teres]